MFRFELLAIEQNGNDSVSVAFDRRNVLSWV